MNAEYCSNEVRGFGIGLVLVVLMTFLVVYLLFFRNNQPENLTQPVGMSQMLFGVLPRPTPLNGSSRRTY